jgi:hypothetical protein
LIEVKVVRRVFGYVLLGICWLIAIDAVVRAVWAYLKLGSFGYHVPLALVLAVFISASLGVQLIWSKYWHLYSLGAALPVLLLLVSRHW